MLRTLGNMGRCKFCAENLTTFTNLHFGLNIKMTDILLALQKFTTGLQEVHEEIAGLGECRELMQSYGVYAKILWDTPRQIQTFKDLCKDGNDLDLLDLLLGDVDPSANENYAIQFASQFGHLAIVDRLLQDSRVDPTADNNFALRFASRNGHHLVVDRLLQDSRVDPSANDNDAIGWASRNGHHLVVDRLLQDSRVNPSAQNNYAIRYASRNGHH